jgi:predicted nucleic acid-binding protein
MIAVLDVSATIEILLRREKGRLFSKVLSAASWVVAPELYYAEISNVFWKYYRGKLVSHEDSVNLAESGIALVDTLVSGHELWKESLAEGVKNGHSVYDMFYLVLARRNDAVLITMDQKLATIATNMKIELCH